MHVSPELGLRHPRTSTRAMLRNESRNTFDRDAVWREPVTILYANKAAGHREQGFELI